MLATFCLRLACGLTAALLGQLKIGPSAKPLRGDAFDVPVTNQDDLGHRVVFP